MLSSARSQRTVWSFTRPMAKRSRTAAKPGQRRPLQRPTGRPGETSTRPRGGVTALEEARAAELEAAIVAQEKAAEEARRTRDRARRSSGDDVGVSYTSVPLSVRAADEYAYVKRDIRRI